MCSSDLGGVGQGMHRGADVSGDGGDDVDVGLGDGAGLRRRPRGAQLVARREHRDAWAARDVEDSVRQEVNEASSHFDHGWNDSSAALDHGHATIAPPPSYQPVRKNWRIKRSATPQWYKQREGVRRHVQSGAARVARFRPPRRG